MEGRFDPVAGGLEVAVQDFMKTLKKNIDKTDLCVLAVMDTKTGWSVGEIWTKEGADMGTAEMIMKGIFSSYTDKDATVN